MLHCSQCSSHILLVCFGHFVVDPLSSNGNTLCSLDRSERCTPTQGIHSFMWQMSQYIEGTDASQRSHRKTSWALKPGSMVWHVIYRFSIFYSKTYKTNTVCYAKILSYKHGKRVLFISKYTLWPLLFILPLFQNNKDTCISAFNYLSQLNIDRIFFPKTVTVDDNKTVALQTWRSQVFPSFLLTGTLARDKFKSIKW